MSAVLVDQSVKLPKEAKEIADLVLILVKDILAKKTVNEIVGDALQPLMSAIEGLDKLQDEVKAPEIAMLAGWLVGEAGQIILQGLKK